MPKAARPMYAGFVKRQRMPLAVHWRCPRGVGSCRAGSCVAKPYRLTPPAASARNRSCTMAAAAGSTPTNAGSRGRSGSKR